MPVKEIRGIDASKRIAKESEAGSRSLSGKAGRLITGIAIAMFLIGVVSIISILLRDNTGPSEIDGVFLRIGGMSLAAGIVVLCRTAGRYQPAT